MSDEGFTRECTLVHTRGLARVTCKALASGPQVQASAEAITHKTFAWSLAVYLVQYYNVLITVLWELVSKTQWSGTYTCTTRECPVKYCRMRLSSPTSSRLLVRESHAHACYLTCGLYCQLHIHVHVYVQRWYNVTYVRTCTVHGVQGGGNGDPQTQIGDQLGFELSTLYLMQFGQKVHVHV